MDSTPLPARPPPLDLGGYSTVSTNTLLDLLLASHYLWRPRVTTYFRYNDDYFGDLATGLTSGTVNMFMGGNVGLFLCGCSASAAATPPSARPPSTPGTGPTADRSTPG